MSKILNYISDKLTRLYIDLYIRIAGNPFINFGEATLKKGTCCICGKALRTPGVKEGHFTIVPLLKKAAWNGPRASFETWDGKKYDGFAVAVICQGCETAFEDGETIRSRARFAVELRKKELIYHDVGELEDCKLPKEHLEGYV